MTNQRAQPGVEHIMRLRERLELSENQINDLDAVRRDLVQFRSGHQAAADELRSQVLAGQLDADAAREQALARREGGEAFHEDVKARIESVLTEAQREELGDIAGEARAFQRGRASTQRGGQGSFRQGRGAVRGGRPGMARQGRGQAQGRSWQRSGRGSHAPAAGRRMMRRGGGEGLGFGGPLFELDTLPPPPPPIG
mgnify:CR=1 FL=1